MNLIFEWDPAKADANLHKHGVAFEIAKRVFADPFHIVDQDRIESGEQRWQTLGMADNMLLLLVAHTIAEIGEDIELVRIISARKATKTEWRRYEQEGR